MFREREKVLSQSLADEGIFFSFLFRTFVYSLLTSPFLTFFFSQIQIQPDMITLDPSSLGQLNTSTSRESGPGAITTASTSSGIAKASDGRPYARLTRMERLRLDGKSDEDGYGVGLTPKYNDVGDGDDEIIPSDSDEELPEVNDNDGPIKVGDGKKKEKKKARGKNGAMKRYLKKQRKNVVDPNTVSSEKRRGKETK